MATFRSLGGQVMWGGIRFPDLTKSALAYFQTTATELSWTATKDCWITGYCYCPENTSDTDSSYFKIDDKFFVAYATNKSTVQGFYAPVKRGQVVKWKNSTFNCTAFEMANN